MKRYILTFIILLQLAVQAQNSPDWLDKMLVGCEPTDSILLDNSDVLIYSSPNGLVNYTVNYDKSGRIRDDLAIGFAVQKKELDSIGREVVLAYYNANGLLQNIPFVGRVYTERIYIDSLRTVRTNYKFQNDSLESAVERVYDVSQREVEIRYFDKNLNHLKRTIFEFDDETSTRLERNYDVNSDLIHNESGVAITKIKFPESGFTYNKMDWEEESYFDEKMNPIEYYHHGLNLSFSKMERIKLSENSFRIKLYNVKNDLIWDEVLQF